MTILAALLVVGWVLAVAFGLDLVRHRRLLADATKDVDVLRRQLADTITRKDGVIACTESLLHLRTTERDIHKEQAERYVHAYAELRELYVSTFELWDEDAAVVDQAKRRRVN